MITDYLPRPLVNITQPKKGESYVDPTFGCKILRLTDESDANTCNVAYAYWPVACCDSTRLVIALDWMPTLYTFDPSTLRFSKVGPLFEGASASLQWEGLNWSCEDPAVIYGLDNASSPARLRGFNVETKKFVYDHIFTELPAGIPNQLSKSRASDRYFSFAWRPTEGQPKKYAVVFDKQLTKTYFFDLEKLMPNFDECHLSRNGDYLFLGTGRESALWKFETQAAADRTVISYDGTSRSGGHYAVGSSFLLRSDLWDSNGNRLIKSPLDNAALWTQVFDSGAKDWTSDSHISLLGPTDEWCLVSTDNTPPDYKYQFTNELWLCKTDGSGGVIGLAHTRTSNSEYWKTPLASLSLDGRFFFWNSDWNGGHCDVYLGVIPEGVWTTSQPSPSPQPKTPAPVPTPPKPTPPPPPPVPRPKKPPLPRRRRPSLPAEEEAIKPKRTAEEKKANQARRRKAGKE